MKSTTSFVPTVLVAVLLAGCADEATPADPDRIVLGALPPGQQHTHTTLVGDGTTPDAGGYRLTDLRFPREARTPSDLSFRILDSRGDPVTDYVEEQTKLLHLYVVRDDYAEFRHLHPVLGDDGTWTARVDLTDPGSYRVIAEFVPAAEADGSHVVLGEEAVVEGAWTRSDVVPASTASDGLVTVAAPDRLSAGAEGSFELTVSDGAGGVLNLGTYLGAFAHLTGFDVETGTFVHAHPIGAPRVTEGGSALTFHTAFDLPGTYRFFVQVRVDGFVHTVPLTTTVA